MFTNLIEILSNFIIQIISATGLWGVFVLMALESACIPIPSEVIMPFSGFLVVQEKLSFWGVVFAGALGNLVGSLLAFYAGKFLGLSFLEKYGKYILISRKDLRKTHQFFEKHGEETVFFSRLLPVIRTFISLPAGVAETEIKKFSIYTFLGSFIWSMFLVFLGVRLGEYWQEILIWFHKFDLLVGIILIGAIILYIKHHLKH